MFDHRIEGRVLTFAPAGDDEKFVDLATGSGWNLWGTAVSGPLCGTQLSALPGHELFWFAWAAFQPDSQIYGE